MAVKFVKLDLGCGIKKQEGHIGVDKIDFPGVDLIFNLADTTKVWPWKENSVDEVYCSHFVEHLKPLERIHFVNELCRILIKGGKATIITPHWASARAYGDPTHEWPPVGEFWFYYLSKEWREREAPHTDVKNWPQGFNCDLEATWGYGMNHALLTRSQEFQQFAMSHYREAVLDMHATLTKK